MARPRSKNSKLSLGGLGMLPSQDERIKFFIERENISSLKYLLRSLLRGWLEEQERKLPETERKRTHKKVN